MISDNINQIEQNLRAAALNERKAALDALAQVDAAVAIPILEKLAAEADFGLRRLAVMGLGNHRTEQSFQALQQILAHEPDSNVLAEAANSLFEFGDRAIPLLQTIFERSDNWLVRQTIVSLLVETQHYDVMLAVAQLALTDATPSVQEIGILALGEVLKSPLADRALAVLKELAQSTDWRIRWRTAIALQHSTWPQAKALIGQFQQDSHFRVVAAALDVAASQS